MTRKFHPYYVAPDTTEVPDMAKLAKIITLLLKYGPPMWDLVMKFIEEQKASQPAFAAAQHSVVHADRLEELKKALDHEVKGGDGA